VQNGQGQQRQGERRVDEEPTVEEVMQPPLQA
jgi:hypothetical protein